MEDSSPWAADNCLFMISVLEQIFQDHNLLLLALAGVTCLLASQSAFSLFHRAEQAIGRRDLWLAAAAMAMGCGIWATHFVAILSYHSVWPIGFDITLSLLSAVIAVAMSGAALWLARAGKWIAGGVVAGVAIGGMHFSGMAALEGPFLLSWELGFVAASIALGIVLSVAAFRLLSRATSFKGRLLVVGIFVLAICSHHFTAMTAATMTFDPMATAGGTTTLERHSLAITLAVVAAILFGAGLLSALIDNYLAVRHMREAERLRHYVLELETTQKELRATTRDLSVALEAAAASSQAKSQFLAAMSHELRTPLNAILGFSELMTKESLGPVANPTYIDYATQIHSSGTQLLSLINDILDFSKIEAGHLELVDDTLDAARLLNECRSMVASQAQEASISIETDLPDGLISLLADRRRLKQIVLNLLSNAVKFSPKGGNVRLGFMVDEAGARLTVSDTGIGMAPEHITVALDPFGQVDSDLNRKFGGTGLGLPLCKRLAELHGGTLSINSKPGEGTTVTVHLPRERLQLARAA